MATRSYLTMLVGPPGAAKTYSRVYWLVHDWIPNHKGPYHSNLPLNCEAIADYCAKRYGKRGITRESVLERLRPIPSSVIDSWLDLGDGAESGPWDYFKRSDLRHSRVDLDEFHNFIHSKSNPRHLQRWKGWLGEIRHQKAEVCAISQAEMKIATPFRQQAALKVELVNGEVRRDPFLRIPMADWYELRASLQGEWESAVFEAEYIKLNDKWKHSQDRKFTLKAEVFDLYDSYAKPHQDQEEDRAEEDPDDTTVHLFETMGRSAVALWFLRTHWWRFLLMSLVLVSAGWFFVGGGFATVSSAFIGTITSFVGNPEATADSEGSQPVVSTQPVTSLPVGDASAQVAALALQVEEMANEGARLGRLVYLSPGRLVFESGVSYSVGDAIEIGPHRGCIVLSIDMQRRCVRLSQGVTLWLASPLSAD